MGLVMDTSLQPDLKNIPLFTKNTIGLEVANALACDHAKHILKINGPGRKY